MDYRFSEYAGNGKNKMNTKQWMTTIAVEVVLAVITLAAPVWVGALLFFGPFLLLAGIAGAVITFGKYTDLISAKDIKKLGGGHQRD